MNLNRVKIIWTMAFAVQLCLVPWLHSQIVYFHDQSGNPTNFVLSSTTGLNAGATDANQTVTAGDQLSLSVTASGSGPFTYQWQRNGVNIAGATNATFFTTNIVAGDAGAYTVITTGATGSKTNQLGTVTVLPIANSLYAAAYGLGKYVAVGTNGTIEVSSNLVSWTAISPVTTNSLKGVGFASGLFVAVGDGGTVLTSANGTNWTVRSSGSSHDLQAVVFGNGIFVAVGAGGTILTSADGSHWMTQTFANATLNAVVYADSLFVTVGTGGTIWTSGNGTNWLARNWPTTEALNGIAYGNGRFVAMGTGGLILTSADGGTWTQSTSGTTAIFTSVLFFTNTFFGLGPIGGNYISTDGATWGKSDAGTYEPLFGSTAGNNLPVAVGGHGTVVVIPYGVVDHFVWNNIASPQRVNQSFTASLTAKDAAGETVSSFDGTVTLQATTTQNWSSNSILNGIQPAWTTSYAQPVAVGYAFTPDADLHVTDLRHYDTASQVSIWDEDGDLLASVSFTNNTHYDWTATPLPAPLTLFAGVTYIVSVYGSTNAFYDLDDPPTFADGTIDQSFIGEDGTSMPDYPDAGAWYLVDFGYRVQRAQTNGVTPVSATFVNGTASVSAAVAVAGDGVTLTATDATGHSGTSNPFDVYGTNNMAVTLAAPDVAPLQSNFTCIVTVVNSGPNAATGVTVTNVLPASVTFVSATPSQGTSQHAGGKVTCNLGTLPNLGSATLTIVAKPTVAGVLLTNTVNVARNEAESNLTDNIVFTTTYVPPTLAIGNAVLYEGNVGLATANVPVTLSAPSALSVYFDADTLDGTNAAPAIAGQDYVASDSFWYLPPGTTNATLPIRIHGNTMPESDKQFLVRLSDPLNASLANDLGTVTILNDDGLPGQVQNFVWGNINSPQLINQPFAASLTAKDAAGNTASNFTGTVTLTGLNVGSPVTNAILGDATPTSSDNVNVLTVGYLFTPTNDIYVTHVRSYGETKVSIWTDDGHLVASQSTISVPGAWIETALPTPVHLYAGENYVVGAYAGGNAYSWKNDGSGTFADGRIVQGYSSQGDAFPANLDSARWYLVDLRYVRAAAVTPATTGHFVNGAWSGSLTIRETGDNLLLMADDEDGHVGFANAIGVYPTNDLAVSLSASPATPLLGTNITYTVTVLNPGPNASTGVLVTNILPAGATFASATASQGTWAQSGGLITGNLGTINALSAATVTIVITPLVAGLPLTNSVFAGRNETDSNLTNNWASSVIVPDQAVSLALSQATEFFTTPWRTSGDNLWSAETNVTHDGIDAAQSGSIIDNQQSWLETTVHGPGTLNFWWKVSSQAGGDKLYFLTNNVAVTNISGTVDWQPVSQPIAPGQMVLRWNYVKDGNISSGADAGWLDQVTFIQTPITLNAPAMNSNGRFVFTVNGTTGQKLVLQNSTNLIRWTPLATNTITGGFINFTDVLATNFVNQFYRAMDVTP
jgi:uncharacterized repeat protein (TIGR01451 family)